MIWIGLVLMLLELGFAIYWSWLQAQQTPSEPRDAPETASETSGNGECGGADTEKPVERRSWLYRFFFGP